MADTITSDDLASKLERAARTAIGDELRSLTYFTPEDQHQVYLREGLSSDADLAGFADTERLGFRSRHDYGDSELGEYRFTVRAFERGYLTRVIAGDHGAFVTCDEMPIDRFSDVAGALRSVLADHEP
jgi:hypothetical protein